MTMEGGKCDICGVNLPIGVASSAFMPMSFAFCYMCLRKPAEAPLVFHYLYTEVFAGDMTQVHPQFNSYYTFRDGEYISWPDWVEKVGKKINLEEYWKEQEEDFRKSLNNNEESENV